MSSLYIDYSDTNFLKYKNFYVADYYNFNMKFFFKCSGQLNTAKTYISELIFNDFRITTEQEFLNLIGGIDVQNSSNNL